jgi:hypothetical protein
VLVEYIPKFLTATNNIKWITAELIAELSDSHSDMYNNPAYGDNKLPVEFGFVEGKLIVTDNRKYVAEGEEPVFELGDEIVSIDGHTPEYFVERTRRYIAASNENVLLRDAAELASRAYNENVSVAIQREGRQMALDITSLSLKEFRDRSDEWLKNKTYYELLNDSVGYIYPAKFDNADGTNAQRVGVRIDHHVTPTIEGIRTGRDEVLEKALEIVANPFSACCGR